MKSKCTTIFCRELVNELERIKEITKRTRNNLTMLVSSDIKETIRIPKEVKRIRICDEKSMNNYKVAIYADDLLK